jgi:pimeloyl-ACP methyl ester carboxylesterase
MSEPSVEHASESLELATGKIHYLRGGAGEPLVVLHHSTGSLGWIPFCAELAREFDVVVPDLPGYGRSERPEWAREPRDLAILIGRAIERLGLDEPTVVGLGMGGFVAAELATMNPGCIGRLVLVGAAGLRPEQGEILDQMLIDYPEYVRAGFRSEEAYKAMFGEEIAQDVQTLWDFSREMTARICWKPYMFNRRLEPLLPDVKIPTLLIWGSQDRVVPPSCAQQYARGLPDATLELIEGAGHLVELEEPARVAQRIAAHVRKALRKS